MCRSGNSSQRFILQLSKGLLTLVMFVHMMSV